MAIREPPGGWAPPWPQARELALAAPNEWILIGGLMVALHSRIAGREPSRTTHDLDALLDLTCTNMQRADGALRGLGYTFAASIDDALPRIAGCESATAPSSTCWCLIINRARRDSRVAARSLCLVRPRSSRATSSE